ncbi:MAG: FAD-binding oxidoreductase, partial [Stackebrandtia sp.]
MGSKSVDAALSQACGEVRPGEDADAVTGVVPSYVARPESVEEVSSVLRAAAEHDLTVTPRGSGTKLDWGATVRGCDVVVDLGKLDRVVDHAAG